MTRPTSRPTFEETLPTSVERVTQELIRALSDPQAPVRGKVGRSSAEIVVVRADRHFWSPYLSLAFDERDGKAVVFGRFTPHPSVWSGFIASYAALGTTALFGAIFGFVQWSLDQEPLGLYASACALVLLATSYGATFVGQNLGSEQMYAMRHFVDRCIERASRDP